MVAAQRARAAAGQGTGKPRPAWRDRRAHRPAQRRTRRQRLFPSALAHPGDEEHASNDLHQDGLVIAGSEGSAGNHPRSGQPAAAALTIARPRTLAHDATRLSSNHMDIRGVVAMLMFLTLLAVSADNAPAKPVPADKVDPVICKRSENDTGTHMRAKSTCLPKSQWDYLQRQAA